MSSMAYISRYAFLFPAFGISSCHIHKMSEQRRKILRGAVVIFAAEQLWVELCGYNRQRFVLNGFYYAFYGACSYPEPGRGLLDRLMMRAVDLELLPETAAQHGVFFGVYVMPERLARVYVAALLRKVLIQRAAEHNVYHLYTPAYAHYGLALS